MAVAARRRGGRGRGRVTRPLAIGVLLAVAGFLLLAGGALLYAQRELVDSSRFADRLASSLRDESVRAVLARRVTSAIESGNPDLIFARPVIRSAAARVAASEPFAAAVRAAAAELHASVFDRSRATARLTVSDVGVLVVDAVRRVSPKLAERLPASIEARSVSLVTVRSKATSAADRVKQLAALAVPALVLALVTMAGALLLIRDRRRRLVAAGATIALAGAAGLLALAIGRGAVLDRAAGGGAQDRAAGEAVRDAYLGGLQGWYVAAVVCGLVIAAAAALVRPGD